MRSKYFMLVSMETSTATAMRWRRQGQGRLMRFHCCATLPFWFVLVISATNLMMLCSLTEEVSKIRKTYDMLCSVTLKSIPSMQANSRVSLDFTPSIFLEITYPWYSSRRKCSTEVFLVDDEACSVPCVIRIYYSYFWRILQNIQAIVTWLLDIMKRWRCAGTETL